VAQQRAENLRAACERASIRLDATQQPCRVTLSCGVALFPAHARRAPELMACADAALYTVKQTGRNNVMAYSLAAPA
jgi:diguanylate cyclase (GGDEF)-like protein